MEFVQQSTPDLPAPGAPTEKPAEAAPGTAGERRAKRLSDLVRLRELGGRLAGAADLDEALRELLAGGASVLGASRGMVVVSGNREWSRSPSVVESMKQASASAPGNRAADAESRPVVGTPTRRTVSAAHSAERSPGRAPARTLGSVELPGAIVGLGLDRAALGALETVPLSGGPFDAIAAGAKEAVHRDLTARPPDTGPAIDATSADAPAPALRRRGDGRRGRPGGAVGDPAAPTDPADLTGAIDATGFGDRDGLGDRDGFGDGVGLGDGVGVGVGVGIGVAHDGPDSPPDPADPYARYLEVAAQLGLGSSYALPLSIGDGPPFGAAVWFRDRPWSPSERTRELARDYCADAARQLSRELERQRLLHTAAALREGLLPDRLPQVPRLRLAARCLPAGLDLAAGSDWYDAIVLPDGTVGLTVGSVGEGGPIGRIGPAGERRTADRAVDGPGAAAAMGRLRAALRAYAVLEGEDPVSVLGDLELLLKTTEPTRTATALYAVVDPATRRLTLAGAGQCPPLLVTNYGASFVETSLSAPLGMLSCWEAPSVELRAERGDLLVLYTEGLARRSGGSLHTGEARLRAAAADAPYEVRQDADRFCGHLLARCLEGTGDAEPVDDLVLMVARFS
ncbi:PP2C family protein-serine/threonine phosphatase [Phaeacidiphilus oryzae]|uniref:PP2C family protein-serine/threonine phosphatase n=1 Tax=Phaeacidiphilus oryzae TaxID=348818 RepID=UPI00068D3884|nr:PP2C family protein-serine/threonine phosphatase [Phaeacidiphilus oryzae]